jgi:Protein of unknown function (DUF1460)
VNSPGCRNAKLPLHETQETVSCRIRTQILALVALISLATPALPRESMATRIEAISAQYLGAPYLLDPLGEGAGAAIDRDPIIRFDAFDCQTFVETVIAEARGSTAPEIEDEMRAMRYQDGVVDFGKRNHFPDADWIPHNVARGILADVSAQVAGNWPLKVARTHITRQAWLASIADNPTQQHNEYLKTHAEARAALKKRARTPACSAESDRCKTLPTWVLPSGAGKNYCIVMRHQGPQNQ